MRLRRQADMVALKQAKARLDDKLNRYFDALEDEHARLADEEWRRLNTVMEDPDCPEKPYKRYMDLTRFQNPELYRQRKRRRVVKQFRYNSVTRTMTEE